ncbi:hypothetical protein TNCV_4870461 [Trichonephila clavipes]|nr:hypothetical protein TNCV_4870461 [Trichonephila clavipes]
MAEEITSGRLPRGRMIEAGGGRCALLERLVVATGTTTAGDDSVYIIRLQAKPADGSQQASLSGNSVQQRGDKCRGLLWQTPSQEDGLFAHRHMTHLLLKVDYRCHSLRMEDCRRPYKKHLDNGPRNRVLFMDESRFGTEAILLQRVLIWKAGTWFYPSNTKERHTVSRWFYGVLFTGRRYYIFERGRRAPFRQERVVTGDIYCDEGTSSPCVSVPRCHWPRLHFYG